MKKKGALLDALSSIVEALTRVTGFVAKLAPLGVFAITANAAGTIDIEELGRLQVFPVCYIVLSLIRRHHPVAPDSADYSVCNG